MDGENIISFEEVLKRNSKFFEEDNKRLKSIQENAEGSEDLLLEGNQRLENLNNAVEYNNELSEQSNEIDKQSSEAIIQGLAAIGQVVTDNTALNAAINEKLSGIGVLLEALVASNKPATEALEKILNGDKIAGDEGGKDDEEFAKKTAKMLGNEIKDAEIVGGNAISFDGSPVNNSMAILENDASMALSTEVKSDSENLPSFLSNKEKDEVLGNALSESNFNDSKKYKELFAELSSSKFGKDIIKNTSPLKGSESNVKKILNGLKGVKKAIGGISGGFLIGSLISLFLAGVAAFFVDTGDSLLTKLIAFLGTAFFGVTAAITGLIGLGFNPIKLLLKVISSKISTGNILDAGSSFGGGGKGKGLGKVGGKLLGKGIGGVAAKVAGVAGVAYGVYEAGSYISEAYKENKKGNTDASNTATKQAILSTVGAAAPIIGTVIGGPVGLAIGTGVSAVCGLINMVIDSNKENNEQNAQMIHLSKDEITKLEHLYDKKEKDEAKQAEQAEKEATVTQDTSQCLTELRLQFGKDQTLIDSLAEKSNEFNSAQLRAEFDRGEDQVVYLDAATLKQFSNMNKSLQNICDNTKVKTYVGY